REERLPSLRIIEQLSFLELPTSRLLCAPASPLFREYSSHMNQSMSSKFFHKTWYKVFHKTWYKVFHKTWYKVFHNKVFHISFSRDKPDIFDKSCKCCILRSYHFSQCFLHSQRSQYCYRF